MLVLWGGKSRNICRILANVRDDGSSKFTLILVISNQF